MPIRENKTKTYIMIGIFAYLFAIFVSLHMGHIVALNSSEKKVSAPSFSGAAIQVNPDEAEVNWLSVGFMALQEMSEEPLNFLPVSWKIVFPLIFFLGIDVFCVGFASAVSDTKRQSAPGKEQGSAKWNTRYGNFNERFVIPYNEKKDDFDPNVIISKRLKLTFDTKEVLKARYPNLNMLSKSKQDALKKRAMNDGRNMNTLVIGGSGTGKSFRIIKPNLSQMNCSTITTDPSGELLQCCGKMLIENGIRLKVFSTSDMKHSNCYNPFDYVYDENGNVDEAKVSTMIFLFLKNAEGCGAAKQKSGDPFWEKSAKAFLSSLAYYLLENPNIDKRDINFSTMLKLTQSGKISEQSDTSQSALDMLMEEHRAKMNEAQKESKALSNYDTFKLAPGKTANSILISCAVDLQLFNNEDVKNLTRHDYDDEENNVHLDEIGDVQTALFINIPQANGTFNFLVSLLYSQMFDALYTKAEKICPKKYLLMDKHNHPVVTMLNSETEASEIKELLKTAEVKEFRTKRGALRYQIVNGKKVITERPTRETAEKIIKNAGEYKIEKGALHLPWHVRCLMDEFANIGEVPEFSEKLSTMRKYEISCTIVVQNIAQIKARYDKLYESIIGGCDTIIFLGSSENETCKYISDSLGETTIRTRNISRNHGNKSGSSESYSATKRMLMTPNEVRNLDNSKCIVLIRGLDPFIDQKYDYTKHPHFMESGNGNKANNITEEFMDIYFNSVPVKTKKTTKKRQQKAVAAVVGTTEYGNGVEGFNHVMNKNEVTSDNIESKVIVEQSTLDNTENKEMFIAGKNPVKEKKKPDTKMKPIEETSSDESTMSDNVFMF